MRRKQQIQAMQQELALLRQTIDSGKELAALANSAAQQLKKPSIRTIAVQVMKTPRFRRAALIAGGAAAVGTVGAIAARYRFYQTVIAQEVKKALKPVHAQLDGLQDLEQFADRLEQACFTTLGEGTMTKDLVGLVDEGVEAHAVTSAEFIAAIRKNLHSLHS